MNLTALPLAAVVGIAGSVLGEHERTLFLDRPPAGFILFARNCAEPGQLQALTASLRALFPDRHVPILIDQEGGRVARLKPPRWPALPAAGRIGELAGRDPDRGREAARLLGGAIAAELTAVGIDVDCAPCLDVRFPETTSAIGDRSFGPDPILVGELGLALMAGLTEGGVLPVIKHLPGHGRARLDSHQGLPVVEASLADLAEVDLVPFQMCRAAPLAMTAHLLLPEIDPQRPATQSRRVIQEVIRGRIGFEGLLFSDDLSMGALSGGIPERALAALDAGCDLALHCNGDPAELEALLEAMPVLSPARFERLQAALGTHTRTPRLAPASLEVHLALLDDLLQVA